MNTAGVELNLSVGLVSKAILHKAGSKIQDELKKRYRGPALPGAVLATAGYNLKCKEVYHTVCAHKSKHGADKVGFFKNHFSQSKMILLDEFCLHSFWLFIWLLINTTLCFLDSLLSDHGLPSTGSPSQLFIHSFPCYRHW